MHGCPSHTHIISAFGDAVGGQEMASLLAVDVMALVVRQPSACSLCFWSSPFVT